MWNRQGRDHVHQVVLKALKESNILLRNSPEAAPNRQYQVNELVPSELAQVRQLIAPGGRHEGDRQGNGVHRARRKKGEREAEDAAI